MVFRPINRVTFICLVSPYNLLWFCMLHPKFWLRVMYQKSLTGFINKVIILPICKKIIRMCKRKSQICLYQKLNWFYNSQKPSSFIWQAHSLIHNSQLKVCLWAESLVSKTKHAVRSHQGTVLISWTTMDLTFLNLAFLYFRNILTPLGL